VKRAKGERNIGEITAKILLDERRKVAREAEDIRDAALEEASPPCARVISKDKRCGHKLNRHDPCTSCACPAFIDSQGRGAREASEAVIAAHPDLFPVARD
jgi:hypothetical protein